MSQGDRNARFFDALRDNNSKVLNEEFGGVRKALVDYLVFTKGADRPGAEDAVSIAFMKLLEAIKNNKIKKKEALYKWLLLTSRSIYRDEKNKMMNKLTEPDEFDEELYVEPVQQIDLMRDPERSRLLELCMDLLTDEMKATLDYLIKFPNVTLVKASKFLRISYMTLRRRKSRITHQLHECVQEKLQHE
ncbi:MAG: hypothetical protein WEB89_11775 [Balneolales bacterium]